MKHQTFLVGLFLILFQLSNVFGQIDQQQYQSIDSLFTSHYKPYKTGATLAIIKNGQAVYKNAIGLANIDHHIPITDTTVFNIASVSKQFTTFLTLILEEEGLLSLEDDIRQYLPELQHLPHKVTIKQLTNHTHGLPNTDALAALKSMGKMTHREVVNMLFNITQFNFEPGSDYEYNNTGYVLLSEIIERVGKKTFKAQLKEKIFNRLGMDNTAAIGNYEEIIEQRASSYQQVNGQYVNYPVVLSTIGSSGIYTTINDLILWAKNYQQTTVGQPEFYERMKIATVTTSGKRIGYGLGLQFEHYKGLEVVFHGGGTEGYRSYLLHVPKHELSIVILSNTASFSALDVMYGSIDILLKNYLEVKTPENTKIDPKQLKAYEGTYEFQPGIYFNIIAEQDTLMFQSFGTTGKQPLPHLGGNTFEFPYIPHTEFVFHPHKFDLNIADFTYECPKVTIQQPQLDEINLADFTGLFKNQDHEVIYELLVVNDQLNLKRFFKNDVILDVLGPKSFYSPDFGKLDFVYDSSGSITGFRFSGKDLKNLLFEKE